MEERYFVVKAEMPKGEAIKQALAKTYRFYETLDAWAEDCVKEWKYYNRRYGWSLKVSWRKKPLYWVVMYRGFFHMGFSIAKNERDDFLALDLEEATRRAITDSKEFPEGFPVEFAVRDEKSFQEAFRLVKKQRELLG